MVIEIWFVVPLLGKGVRGLEGLQRRSVLSFRLGTVYTSLFALRRFIIELCTDDMCTLCWCPMLQ